MKYDICVPWSSFDLRCESAHIAIYVGYDMHNNYMASPVCHEVKYGTILCQDCHSYVAIHLDCASQLHVLQSKLQSKLHNNYIL